MCIRDSYQTAAEAKRLQYESAKIAYENQMEFSHVTSPINGRVEQLNVEVHDTVGNSNQLCVIAGDSGNNVTFYVTEKVKNHLNAGDPITVIKEGTEYGGNVIEVSNMAEASVGLFKIKASVDDNEAMAAGTSVELRVPSASARNAMLIPNNCVYYKSGDAYVYTYDSGIIHEVPVEVGIYDSENIAVLSGITLDDRIPVSYTHLWWNWTRIWSLKECWQIPCQRRTRGIFWCILMIRRSGPTELRLPRMTWCTPVSYTHLVAEARGIREDSVYQLDAGLEQLSAVMMGGDMVEVKAVIALDFLVLQPVCEPVITGAAIHPMDLQKLQELPGIVGYIVQPEDSLWEIAKKFHTTVGNIISTNELADDQVKPGQRLLLSLIHI